MPCLLILPGILSFLELRKRKTKFDSDNFFLIFVKSVEKNICIERAFFCVSRIYFFRKNKKRMGWKAWTSAVHFICSSWLLLINFLSSSNLCCVVVKLACVEISIGHTSTHIILAFPFCPIMQLSTKKNKQKYLLFYLFFFGGGGIQKKRNLLRKEKALSFASLPILPPFHWFIFK